MKSVTNYSPSYQIKIIATDKTLQAIKHIVSIAPQEAQWFHTVEAIPVDRNNLELHLSEKLYIPKQNTSAAEVDSTSAMMIEFYNDLKQDYSDQDVVNQKLQAMTCWCHSHHNMAPNPSGQDHSQFANFINQSTSQGLQSWQIMLIFNKRGEFYSKVYDPTTGIVWQGVPIQEPSHSYDFAYIDEAAKTKFLKPPSKFKPKAFSYSFPKQHSVKPTRKTEIDPFNINDEVASDLIDDLYEPLKIKLTTATKAKVSGQKKSRLSSTLNQYLDEKEYLWFLYYINDQEARLLSSARKLFSNEKHSLISEIDPVQEQLYIDNYFTKTKDTLDQLKDKLSFVLHLCDCTSYQSFESVLMGSLID